MPQAKAHQPTTSERLLDVLDDYQQALVVMHDNPDPDAIASGWGLEVLVRERLGKPVRVLGGGAIVRAENRHMVELLQPPIELVQDAKVAEGSATILVDCGTAATNHLLTRQGQRPVAIIDHHTTQRAADVGVLFEDIRPDVAASATIVADYLREQGIEPGFKLATAMIYAIRTETCGQETHYSMLDRRILPWLTERAEPALLAEIENAPLTLEYFGDLSLALQSTLTYDDTALCFLPRVTGPEIVGEVADLLIRCDSLRRVLCAAIIKNDLLLSARTQRGFGSAVDLLLETLDGLGGAGGHTHRAGGKIENVVRGGKAAEAIHAELRRRWLTACGIEPKRGTRFIGKREIEKNLQR